MFSRSLFHQRHFTLARLAALCALLLILALAMVNAVTHRSHAAARQQLSFEDRVAAQRAIEEVYHRHRIWPTDNPQPKPSLEAMIGEDALRGQSAKVVEDALRLSTALAVYWQRPLTAADLQAEVDRMARDTRQPDLLRQLWAALRDDPLLVAECLARPLLAERLVRMRIEDCGVRNEGCEALGLVNSANPQSAISNPQSPILNPQFEEWWRGVRAQMEMAEAAGGEYRLPEIAAVAAPCGTDWTATSTTSAPSARRSHSAVWTGSEMIVWGGRDNNNSDVNTGGRYNPATDSWTATTTTSAPSGQNSHTAVWTGSEMIIWGGNRLITGGRYNPVANAWTATSTTNAPIGRLAYSAVWTGTQMIVWGGDSGPFASEFTGGRYTPATDTWTATSTVSHPGGRDNHTAIWTGTEMIVWGGYATDDRVSRLNTGGRYNPATDTWAATSTNNAPTGRGAHTAVWTGSEMLVWGGFVDTSAYFNTGGRYNPATDSWTATNTTGALSARVAHTAVWTGSEMIVFGGTNSNGYADTGGRYNPTTNSWIVTSTTNAPSARESHTAIWTSGEMIVWGGNLVNSPLNTGGRYSITPPLTISQTTQSFPATGGTGNNIAVTAQGGCTWTATSNANWLTITQGSSGAGNGTVAFTVAANTLGPRTGLLTIGTQTFTVRQAGVATPRLIRVNATNAAPGSSGVPVAVELVAQGDENALGFTLSFDPAVLSSPQAALGADAVGAQLAANTNQTAQGRLGLAVALPAGQKFAAGTRQLIVVTFSIAAAAPAAMTMLDFDDLPSAREVSDVSAGALPAAYQGGALSVVPGVEGDVAPRPQGNGSVTITDWVQVGRLVAGLDAAAPGVEFQRADCAPRDTKGDGRLTVSDWTQAGRYSVGTDAAAAAGGPVVAASQSAFAASVRSTGFSRSVRGTTLPPKGGTTNIELDAQGNENALGFSLCFDPAQWRFVAATVGSDAAGATLHVNDLAAKSGRIGIALALPSGRTLAAGARQIVVLSFAALHNRIGQAAIEFADFPVLREVVDAEANVLPVNFAIGREATRQSVRNR